MSQERRRISFNSKQEAQAFKKYLQDQGVKGSINIVSPTREGNREGNTTNSNGYRTDYDVIFNDTPQSEHYASSYLTQNNNGYSVETFSTKFNNDQDAKVYVQSLRNNGFTNEDIKRNGSNVTVSNITSENVSNLNLAGRVFGSMEQRSEYDDSFINNLSSQSVISPSSNNQAGDGVRQKTPTEDGLRDPNQALRDFAADRGDDIFGVKPQVADFDPVTASEAIQESVEASLENIGMTRQAIEQFIPQASETLQSLGSAASRLAKGELPFDEVQRVMSDRAEISNLMGTPGGDSQVVLKDLGLTQLDAIDRGLSMFERMVATSDVLRENYEISPLQNLQSMISQRIYDTENQQQQFNVDATPDPTTRAIFGLMAPGSGISTVSNALSTNPFQTGQPFENQNLNEQSGTI